MESIISALKSLVHYPDVIIDNSTFRLHYRITTVILIACSILVTATQLFGDPIKCIPPKSDIEEDFLNTYCWIHTTFSVEKDWNSTNVIYPGVSTYVNTDKRVFHAYYQWVCFFLFIQAIFFYLPHYFWKVLGGERLKSLFPDELAPISNDSDKKESIKKDLVIYLYKWRNWNNGTFSAFVFAEYLNLLNTIFQIWVIDKFLNGQFVEYGLEVMKFNDWQFDFRYDPMIRVFPRMTKCSFYRYGVGGEITKLDSLCILPINILNEKIFVFFWFWLCFIGLATCMQLMYRIVYIISPEIRHYYFKNRVRDQVFIKLGRLKEILSVGDYFILMIVGENVDRVDFEDIIESYYELEVPSIASLSNLSISRTKPPHLPNCPKNPHLNITPDVTDEHPKTLNLDVSTDVNRSN